jgi:myo-inositol-1(or 4)-monophosphatase
VDEGELVAGVILDVPRNELFTAQRGTGAFVDGRRIEVSTIGDPSRALVGTGFPFKHPAMLDVYQGQFARILRASAGIRRAGSAALDLANVACGRFDAFWELRLAPWDMAAGILLVREAGGMVTDTSGREIQPYHGEVVATNKRLHSWLLEQLR